MDIFGGINVGNFPDVVTAGGGKNTLWKSIGHFYMTDTKKIIISV